MYCMQYAAAERTELCLIKPIIQLHTRAHPQCSNHPEPWMHGTADKEPWRSVLHVLLVASAARTTGLAPPHVLVHSESCVHPSSKVLCRLLSATKTLQPVVPYQRHHQPKMVLAVDLTRSTHVHTD